MSSLVENLSFSSFVCVIKLFKLKCGETRTNTFKALFHQAAAAPTMNKCGVKKRREQEVV